MALDAKVANVGILWQRNLNRAVVGGSGSGKTFFDLLLTIMQANSSYFVTDPKGQTLPMAGGLLEERGYRVLAFDTTDFSKSLHYNPIAYVDDEADILELAGCLIANTSGDDRHVADPFWENAERLLYVALIGYLIKHCPREDRSLSGVVTLLSLARAKETDEDYVNPLDLLFYEMETGMRYVEVDATADVDADPLSRTASGETSAFGGSRWQSPSPSRTTSACSTTRCSRTRRAARRSPSWSRATRAWSPSRYLRCASSSPTTRWSSTAWEMPTAAAPSSRS